MAFSISRGTTDKFIKTITAFEGPRFFQHPGFDIIGIGQAITQNLKERKIVSGANTISMQVIHQHILPQKV